MLESLLIGFIGYQIIAHVGISAGLHRYWAHKSFTAGPIFEIVTLYFAEHYDAHAQWDGISAHRMHHHHRWNWIHIVLNIKKKKSVFITLGQ